MPNKLTPGSNLLWESSRIILPEHREALIEWRKKRNMKQKPVLDEQAWEEYARLIQESMQTGRLVTVHVYDPYEDIKITGQVVQIDRQRIRFTHDYKKTWIPFEDILSVSSV